MKILMNMCNLGITKDGEGVGTYDEFKEIGIIFGLDKTFPLDRLVRIHTSHKFMFPATTISHDSITT